MWQVWWMINCKDLCMIQCDTLISTLAIAVTSLRESDWVPLGRILARLQLLLNCHFPMDAADPNLNILIFTRKFRSVSEILGKWTNDKSKCVKSWHYAVVIWLPSCSLERNSPALCCKSTFFSTICRMFLCWKERISLTVNVALGWDSTLVDIVRRSNVYIKYLTCWKMKIYIVRSVVCSFSVN